jgi:hypothetical protein
VTIIWSKQLEPFYMTFPMQNLFLAELEYEKDFERMKELYPREVSKIAELVSDRCDELEFEGSRIYDENPDRMMMAREAQTLYEKIKKELGLEEQSDRMTEKVLPGESDAAAAGTDGVEAAGGTAPYSSAFSLQPPSDWMLQEEMDAAELPSQPNLEQQSPEMPWQQPGPAPQPWQQPGFLPQPPGPPKPGPQPPNPPQSDGCSDWLCSVVGILLSNEIYKRRCRYRRSQRWW